MAMEEGSACSLRRLPWGAVLRNAVLILVCSLILYLGQPRRLESPSWDIAELQLNHTGDAGDTEQSGACTREKENDKVLGTEFVPRFSLHTSCPGYRPRQDPRLYWQGGPALGRSFLYGPQLDNGQLRVQRDGIYKLHIQVTLSNCSSFMKSIVSHRATLTVGICSPSSHSISLLRLNFHSGCTVASQRLTPLAHGDTLCTNLTLPLLPSQNADETFFGIQWVHS
ncbi:CD70 antigen [Pteropus alecto]|uniref:CD70 antigen n=1 Tax=Pteropus alecto TaxID=9402 RepID=UPI000D5369BE|nr:CD70 antigen [Pteropus alecto]